MFALMIACAKCESSITFGEIGATIVFNRLFNGKKMIRVIYHLSIQAQLARGVYIQWTIYFIPLG